MCQINNFYFLFQNILPIFEEKYFMKTKLFKSKKQTQIEKLNLEKVGHNLYKREITGKIETKNWEGKIVKIVRQHTSIFYYWDIFDRMFIYSHSHTGNDIQILE